MFQFRRFPSYTYFIQCTMLEYCSSGFPHSEISGSMRMCRSPKLIAACHVLRRLLMPRHSPCALISLTYSNNLLFWFSNYAGISNRFSFRNCNCYPSIRCSTINSFSQFCLSVALLFLLFLCSVFKVQMSLRADACTLKIKHCKPV